MAPAAEGNVKDKGKGKGFAPPLPTGGLVPRHCVDGNQWQKRATQSAMSISVAAEDPSISPVAKSIFHCTFVEHLQISLWSRLDSERSRRNIDENEWANRVAVKTVTGTEVQTSSCLNPDMFPVTVTLLASEGQEGELIECPRSDRFEVGDPAALAYLEEHGYVVLKAVADAKQLEHAEQLLFEWMGKNAGWNQNDPDTWTDESLEKVAGANGIAKGLIGKCGSGHSDLNWYVRALPKVRSAFEQVWGTSDLVTSFDCFGVFRPWHTGKFFKTLGGWFHVDQGTPGRQCIQGLLSIYDQDASTGGLIVIPGSHQRFEEHTTSSPSVDYIAVDKDHPIWQGPHRLVQMCAGDFVLWDSRTVHCNSPAVEMPTTSADRLLRAVVYVCMAPRSFASAEILEKRIMAFNNCMTTSHWPYKNPMGWGFKRDPPLDYENAPADWKALI